METSRLRLDVVPRAANRGVMGRYGDGWKIRVTAVPEAGRANEAVLEVVAAALQVHRREVRLVSGHGSRDKIVEVTGLEAADLEARLTSATRKDA